MNYKISIDECLCRPICVWGVGGCVSICQHIMNDVLCLLNIEYYQISWLNNIIEDK